MAALEAGYREQALLLGPRRSLLTIATRPVGRLDADAPAIVVLNTGIVHRVGHNRMYVTLSRKLAERCCLAVRFDFSGIGDSAPRNDGVAPLLAGMEEIRTVIDWMQATYGVRTVVLAGLCMGADQAVLYSRSDTRVSGLVLMDPSMPPTERYYFHYLMQRLGRLRNWLSVMRGRSGIMRLMSSHFRHRMRPSDDLRGLTLQNLRFSSYLRQCYKTAAERRIRLLTVFTSISARHTYHRQILDAFPEVAAGAGLRLEYFPGSDHVFSDPEERARLDGAIIDWLGLD